MHFPGKVAYDLGRRVAGWKRYERTGSEGFCVHHALGYSTASLTIAGLFIGELTSAGLAMEVLAIAITAASRESVRQAQADGYSCAIAAGAVSSWVCQLFQ